MGKRKTLLLMILSVIGSSLLKFEIYFYKIWVLNIMRSTYLFRPLEKPGA